jgi:peptide/nickel transport system substrate-binding protein
VTGWFGRRCQRKIKLLGLLLCGVLLLGGCTSAPQQTPQSEVSQIQGKPALTADTLTLAYTANDSLNPYLAKTKTNQELTHLLYDSLIVLEDNFTPRYRLAKDITVKGTKVTISLEEAYFTDGSRVTAQDVLFSMESAMTARTMSYAKDFSVVTEKMVIHNEKLELTLAHEDPHFVNFLDFPVFKKGSQDKGNDDNKDLPPVGSGRYLYHEESGDYWLTANEKWIGGTVNIKTITLLNLPDNDAIEHAVQVGTVDWFYSDLQDNIFPPMNGISKNVSLNNLVYLGCNVNSGFMSVREIRLGVSAALDRTDITQNAYFGVATPATGFFPAGLEEADGFQSIASVSDKDRAIDCFESAGFTVETSEGYRSNGSDDLAIRVIFNKENSARESAARMIAEKLKTVGCKVSVEGFDFAKYRSAIKQGYYDIYIGEIRLPDNLSLYPLFTAGGLVKYPALTEESEPEPSQETEQETQPDADASFETDESSVDVDAALRAVSRFHNGEGGFAEMLSCLNEQLPVIPLCHRKGMLIYSDFISGEPTPIFGDPFHGIESCTIQ